MDGRSGIQSHVVDSSTVCLGGNEFESGAINVPANGTIAKGAVLKRSENDFALLTDLATETPVAVNPIEIENKRDTAVAMSVRAIIFGPVRADLLTINGQPTTPAQNDLIRDHTTIIPIKAHNISVAE